MLRHKQNIHQDSARLSPGLFQVELTKRAKRALAMNEQALYVEMQLHYGCMLRKELRFTDTPPQGSSLKVTQGLYVGYQTFMGGEACGLDGKPASAKLPGTPRWLTIDYKKGHWSGNFGLTSKTISTSDALSEWISGLMNRASNNYSTK